MTLIADAKDERLVIIAEDQENTDTNLPERRLLLLSLRAALERAEKAEDRADEYHLQLIQAERERDALKEKVNDVEGMARVLSIQPTSFTEYTLATAALKWEKSKYDAAALSAWLKGEG